MADAFSRRLGDVVNTSCSASEPPANTNGTWSALAPPADTVGILCIISFPTPTCILILSLAIPLIQVFRKLFRLFNQEMIFKRHLLSAMVCYSIGASCNWVILVVT